jgi:hypothetical protein
VWSMLGLELSNPPISFKNGYFLYITMDGLFTPLVYPVLVLSRHRNAYFKQLPKAAALVKDTVKSVGSLLIRHPHKLAPIIGAFHHWNKKYIGAQKKSPKKAYLVYTDFDHKIPFKPDYDLVYIRIISQLLKVCSESAHQITAQQMKFFGQCFKDMNEVTAKSFKRYQTTTPRFHDHDRLALRVVQHADEPINSCPSIHISYSVFLYNMSKYALNLPKENPTLWKEVDHVCTEMFNSVLYTKQHACIDLSFGMAVAHKVFTKRFKNLPFDSMSAKLQSISSSHPEIQYKYVIKWYNYLVKEMNQGHKIVELVGRYLKAGGFKRVKVDGCKKYFDTRLKKPVSF